jgi:hypothetical protein
MRRRERYKGLVWIKTLPGDPAEGRALPRPQPPLQIGTALFTLTGDYGLFVEIELRDGCYSVRTFPHWHLGSERSAYPAAAYASKGLAWALNQATLDYRAYTDDADRAVLSPREVIRWVA